MFNIEVNPTLHTYALICEDENILKYVNLSEYEAKQKNYAYRLNRVNKYFKLVSEVETSTRNNILVLPRNS